MVSLNIGAILPEILVAAAHFIFTNGIWSVGHFFYLMFVGCDEAGFNGCSSSDPLGYFAYFSSSILFMYIARHVLNFLYKGTLPGGEDIAKKFGNAMGQTKSSKKNRRK